MNEFSVVKLIDSDGWWPAAEHRPSPNQDERPPGLEICLLVVHAISLPPQKFGGPGIVDLFLNQLDPNAHPYFGEIGHLRVSAHFLIRRDGKFIQFVSCNRRAWHAGVSTWNGLERCNDFSIGIELEGCDEAPFETEQYVSLNQLTESLRQSFPIKAIVGHSEIAAGRKTDPGPCFDWSRVAYRELQH